MRHEEPVRHTIAIRKGDQVRVMTGRDRGKTGRVLAVNPAKNTVTVEHAHIIKRHTRPNPAKNIKGGIVEKEGPIAVSNVLLVCPSCGKPTRLGRKVTWERVQVALRDGSTVEHEKRRLAGRVCRRCEATI